MTEKELINFIKEYIKLCNKYNCYILSEDPYCGLEINEINNKISKKVFNDTINQLKERYI